MLVIPPLEPQVLESSLDALRTHGFAIIKDFLDASECTRLCDAMDDYISREPDKVQGNDNTDDRIFAAENVDDVILSFKYQKEIKEIATAFVGAEQDALMTMANRVMARDGVKIRSGGRWHRDRKSRQFKAMTYLSDVSDANGPFAILPSSAIESSRYAAEVEETSFEYGDQRWSNPAIGAFLKRVEKEMRVLTAAKGTLILFDSSLIHSGMEIKQGTRYALTNYYYNKEEIDLERVRRKWGVSAGPIDF